MKLLALPSFLRRTLILLCLPPALLLSFLYVLISMSLFPFLGIYQKITISKKSSSRHVRFSLMFTWYLLMELLGVVVAFFLWVVTICGYFLQSRISQRLHAFVQFVWASSLLFGARLFFNATIVFPSFAPFRSGPLLIAAQHSSFFDALIPTVLLGKGGGNVVPRHVLKNDLLLSPSLDLYGNRLPNVFVTRGAKNSGLEVSGVHSVTTNLGSDGCIIFPEGTFHTPEKFERAIKKIKAVDPSRAQRVNHLKHLLPIKPGGVLAMVSAAPKADLVLIGHHGFKPFGSFKEIMLNIPFKEPIEIYVKRIPPPTFPKEASTCLKFLDNEWLTIDNWLQSKIENHDDPS